MPAKPRYHSAFPLPRGGGAIHTGRKGRGVPTAGALGAFANSCLALLKERQTQLCPRAEWPLACRLTSQPQPVGWLLLQRGWLRSRLLGTK